MSTLKPLHLYNIMLQEKGKDITASDWRVVGITDAISLATKYLPLLH